MVHPFTFAGFDLTLCSTACTCRLLPLLQQTCPAPGKAPKAAVNQIKTYRFRLKPTRAQAQAPRTVARFVPVCLQPVSGL
nr:hypothetical protein [Pontibacter korlensis]